MKKLPVLTVPDEMDIAIRAAAEKSGCSLAEWLREYAIRPALYRGGAKVTRIPAVTNGGYGRVLAGREKQNQAEN